MILSRFLFEVPPLGLVDATAFLDSLASRATIGLIDHLGLCLTRWLPAFAPLPLLDHCSRLLRESHRSWYHIVVYFPGDCRDGVL